MATDFHFFPLAPEPISGSAVLRQTEQALNDLGARIDQADQSVHLVQEAVSSAQSAETTANTALTTAQNAHATASNVQAKADQALSAAQAAQTSADAVSIKANEALALAQTVESQAQVSFGEIEAALARAEETVGAVENVQHLALKAQTRADEAMGVCRVDDTGSDPDDLYLNPGRHFLVSLAEGCTLPVTLPAYLTVECADDTEHVRQHLESESAPGVIFARMAIVTLATEEVEQSIVWTEWARIGGKPAPEPEPVVTWLPVSFDPLNENPVRTVIPSDVTTASLTALDSDKDTTEVTLTMRLSFGNADTVIPVAPEQVDISAFRGRSVDIVFTGLPDDAYGAAALIRLE